MTAADGQGVSRVGGGDGDLSSRVSRLRFTTTPERRPNLQLIFCFVNLPFTVSLSNREERANTGLRQAQAERTNANVL